MRFDARKLSAALFAASMLPNASCRIDASYCSGRTELSDLMSDGNYTNFVAVLQNRADNFVDILRVDDPVRSNPIDVRNETAPVRTLKATQNEIGLSDSLLFALNPEAASRGALPNSSKYILEILRANRNTVLRPQNIDIIIAGDSIIDGHHRWSTIALLNPTANIGVLNMHGSKDAIDALKITQLAILAAQGKLPTSSKRGVNMLTMPKKDIYPYIAENIAESVLKDLMVYFGVTIPHDAITRLANIVGKNLDKIRSENVNLSHDISRSYMPQTDRSGMWMRALRNVPHSGGRMSVVRKTRRKRRTTTRYRTRRRTKSKIRSKRRR